MGEKREAEERRKKQKAKEEAEKAEERRKKQKEEEEAQKAEERRKKQLQTQKAKEEAVKIRSKVSFSRTTPRKRSTFVRPKKLNPMKLSEKDHGKMMTKGRDSVDSRRRNPKLEFETSPERRRK